MLLSVGLLSVVVMHFLSIWWNYRSGNSFLLLPDQCDSDWQLTPRWQSSCVQLFLAEILWLTLIVILALTVWIVCYYNPPPLTFFKPFLHVRGQISHQREQLKNIHRLNNTESQKNPEVKHYLTRRRDIVVTNPSPIMHLASPLCISAWFNSLTLVS